MSKVKGQGQQITNFSRSMTYKVYNLIFAQIRESHRKIRVRDSK